MTSEIPSDLPYQSKSTLQVFLRENLNPDPPLIISKS